MQLRVDPAQLEEFAGQVHRGAEDARGALEYARSRTRIGWVQGGLIGLVSDQHDELRDDVSRALERLAGILADSARELRTSASYYRRTDRRVATELDACYAAPRR
ncbi:type VII secretion target [Streptomyces sp. NPDC049577]|uniref:type VII secretion target n=1 Tax=Streptomyces sp. NPDC049577 TaxID=3155153 RepID=UPI00341B73FE